MLSHSLIGILSLAGSKNTTQFLDKYFEAYNKKKGISDNDWYSNVILYAISDYNYNLSNFEEAKIKNEIKLLISLFKNVNINCLVLPNSLLFKYYNFITENINVPVFIPVKEASEYLQNMTFKKIALITNEKILGAQFYQEKFKKNSINFFHNDNLQDMVNEIIICIKQSGINTHVKRVFSNMNAYLSLNHCDSVLVDNSEMRRIFNESNSKVDIKIVDSIHILNELLLNTIVFNQDENIYKKAL